MDQPTRSVAPASLHQPVRDVTPAPFRFLAAGWAQPVALLITISALALVVVIFNLLIAI
jgi:hypothetical protein